MAIRHRLMNVVTVSAVLCAAIGSFATPLAPVSGGPYLWVASGSGGGHTAVIDAATDTIDTTVGVVGTYGTAFLPDGTLAYLTDVFHQELVVIDTTTRAIIQRVPIPGGGLRDVVVTPDGTTGFVSVSSGLLSFDPVTRAITGSIAAPPSGQLGMTPDGQKLYVSDTAAVVSIDIATGVHLATIPTGLGPTYIAFTPDGSRAYVPAWYAGFITVIDVATDTVLPPIVYELGSAGAGQLAIDASGTFGYLVTAWSDKLYVLDLAAQAVVATVPSGDHTIGVAVSPDGSRVYVSDHFVSQVHVFDATTLALAAPSLTVGGNTRYLAFQPRGLRVDIDIKPGSYPNSINAGSNGNVPVAIFSSAAFDATTVDPLTVTLASGPIQLRGNGTPMTSLSDVNGDGLTDIVVHVATESLLLSDEDTEAMVEGETLSGIPFTGTDTVRIVPQD